MSQTADNSFPLASETAPDDGTYQGDDAGTIKGASGKDTGNAGISQGALIAIIVVVVVVAVLGISTAALFYLAKKREWKVRENIRKSARKVITAITPRRSEFPRELKDDDSTTGTKGPRSKARARMDDVPPTPRLRPDDLEKGMEKAMAKKKQMRWGK